MEKRPTNTPESADEQLTDSPWFWLLAFTGCGLALLEVFGPKYARRQAQIERQHQARQWAQVESVAGEAAAEESVEYTVDGETAISLWPIRAVALVILCIAVAALWIGRGPDRRSNPSQGSVP